MYSCGPSHIDDQNEPIYNSSVLIQDVALKTSWEQWTIEMGDESFFQAAVVLILLYGCTTWMLTKLLEKKIDGNYTRIL